MLEYAPVGIPGGGFITKGVILSIIAFSTIYYFRDNIGKRTEV